MTNRLPNRSERQTAIYVNGFAGKRSKIPVDAAKLEQKAITQMSKKAAAYIAGGAGLQSSVTNNRTSFALVRGTRNKTMSYSQLKLSILYHATNTAQII